uniref:Lecithin retinol acyltransferase a n=1 Tax=Eptatretus burgeri TaxID=7764 RepID=A0A8C4R3B9_EPTBU
MEMSKELPKGQELRGCAYKRGDMLQVPRTIFTHFGIYLGNRRVAHFLPDILPLLTNDQRLLTSVVTNTRLILGCMARKGTVRIDCLEDFVYGAPVVRVNVLDSEDGTLEGLNSLPPEEVAQRAEHYLGDLVYSLLWNNCEHFVTYCRYGTARSLQTDKLCAFLKRCIRDRWSILPSVLLGLVFTSYFGPSIIVTLLTAIMSLLIWMAG